MISEEVVGKYIIVLNIGENNANNLLSGKNDLATHVIWLEAYLFIFLLLKNPG